MTPSVAPQCMPAVNMAPGHGMPGNLSSNQVVLPDDKQTKPKPVKRTKRLPKPPGQQGLTKKMQQHLLQQQQQQYLAQQSGMLFGQQQPQQVFYQQQQQQQHQQRALSGQAGMPPQQQQGLVFIIITLSFKQILHDILELIKSNFRTNQIKCCFFFFSFLFHENLVLSNELKKVE